MTDNQLPEERLLKLIRGEKKPVPKPTLVDKPLPKPAVPVIKPKPKKHHLRLKHLLIFIIIIMLLAISGQLFYYYLDSRMLVPKRGLLPNADLVITGSAVKIEDFSNYNNVFSSRNIFKSVTTGGEAPGAEPKISRAEILEKISLLGIISGARPQAIIEDKTSNQSYFLSEGDGFGVLKVEKVETNKVLINYDGEKIELSL